MSHNPPPESDPRLEKAAASDESIQEVHASLLRKHADFNESGSRVPLFLLGLASVMIFIAAIYMVHHRGGFDPLASDARFDPRTAVAAAKVEVNPVAEGQKLFTTCAACHQPTGQGIPSVFPPLAGSEWVNGTEERVIRIVLSGLQGAVKVKGGTYNGAMPAFGPGGFGWTDDKIAYVLTFVRQSWGNTAAAITPEKVAEVRGKIGQRKSWSEAELESIH